jgi:hypothetical protein
VRELCVQAEGGPALAGALDGRREEIVAVADRETALDATRLGGELTGTCYQLRLFAEVLDEGSYLEAAIDHPGDTPMGPRPDLRRMLLPLGPVAVFGASNFPLAFLCPAVTPRPRWRGVPRRGEGARLPPADVAAVLRGDERGAAPARGTGGHARAWAQDSSAPSLD